MKISQKAWKKYIEKLNKLDTKASNALAEYFRGYDVLNASEDELKRLLDCAYALATYYGEGAGELACEMYDAIGIASGKTLPPAEPAPTATYGEVAKAVQGAMLRTQNPDAIGAVVGTKVKTVGLDTMLKNSLRDGAEFAWIPSGDTCPFCIMLASNGWQRASKKALKNGHAEHVHNNCDCTYAIRFDENTEVEGYDPDYYKEIYDNAEGHGYKEKINSMRRENYATNKDLINAQKRAAYALRKENEKVTEKERLLRSYSNKVQMKAIDAPGFVEKFKGITGIEDVDNAIYNSAKEILEHRNGTDFEDIYLIDANSGNIIHKLTTCDIPNGVDYDDETIEIIRKARKENRKIIAIHNHPGGLPPSMDDGVSSFRQGYIKGIAVGHNLEVYSYSSTDDLYTKGQCQAIHDAMNKKLALTVDFDEEYWYNILKNFGMDIRRL